MREKRWEYKTAHRSRHLKHGKGFPRQLVKKFDGTHLGWNRAKCLRSDFGWGACLHTKYVIGLLYKFVGKPYKDFLKVFDSRIKHIKPKTDEDLHRILKDRIGSSGHNSFYINSKGILLSSNSKTVLKR